MKRLKIVVSSCLLGNHVRYNGGSKKNIYINDTLLKWFEPISICPEVGCGLSVPREAMCLFQNNKKLHLTTINTHIDYTEKIKYWMEYKQEVLKDNDIAAYILKSKSPTCGVHNTKIFNYRGKLINKFGSGLFSYFIKEKYPFIPIISEYELNTGIGREEFILSVFLLSSWRDVILDNNKFSYFHTRHKYLLLSISGLYYNLLNVVFNSKKSSQNKIDNYGKIILKISKIRRRPGTIYKVLKSLFNIIKDDLKREERYELLHVIEMYKKQSVPLISPIILINHYITKLNIKDLLDQVFLKPEPAQLNLLYHS